MHRSTICGAIGNAQTRNSFPGLVYFNSIAGQIPRSLPAHQTPTMQVLLVEDEQALAQFIRKGFQHEGYELTVAYDGLVGQSLLRQHRYDLIILDVNLPHVNGFELCREARTLLPDVPVLMLTALDSLDDKVTGFEAGADEYLAKQLRRARARRHTAGGPTDRRVLHLTWNYVCSPTEP